MTNQTLRTAAGPPSGRSNALLTATGLALALPLPAAYLAQALTIKLLQVSSQAGEVRLISGLLAAAPDAAFALIGAALLAWFLSRLSGWPRQAVHILGLLLYGSASILLAASHGYFAATGANLSFSVIDYWLHNMSVTTRVMSSEAAPWRLLLLYAQGVLVLAAAVVPRLAVIRRRLLRRNAISPRRSRALLAGAALLGLGLLFLPKPPGAAMAVARCIPLAIAKDALSGALSRDRAVQIASDERMDAPLELSAKPGAPRPNIVFFVFESLNWKSTDVYFDGIGTTPFLAQLAQKGLVVDTLYTIVPHTTKAIVPILCGLHPYLETEPKEATPGILPRRCLPHLLRQQGYRSAFFQPAGSFEKREQLVANMGFDAYRSTREMPSEGFETTSYFGKEDRMMVQPSLDWIESLGGEPFFLTYLTLATHHNYVTPQSFPYTEYQARSRHQSNYFNAVRYLDDVLREVVAQFERRGWLENTVFFIIGDHGEAFGEHGRGQHDMILWEEGLRSAGLIYGPAHLQGPRRIRGVRSNLDWVPTVCDLLGLEPRQGNFLGTSLLQSVGAQRKLFYSCWFEEQCLAQRVGSQKTIYHYGLQPAEVYDNAKDPLDERDLAYSNQYGEDFLNARQEEMLRWRQVVNAQYDAWEKSLDQPQVTAKRPALASPAAARFADAIELVGYEITPSLPAVGQTVRIELAFRALTPISNSVALSVQLRHPDGVLDIGPAAGRTASLPGQWKKGQFAVIEHTAQIPSRWATGQAELHIGLDGSAADSFFRLASIQVKGRALETGVTDEERRARAGNWVGFARPSFASPLSAIFGGAVELVGVTFERVEVELAGTAEMTYVFSARRQIEEDWIISVRLRRSDGHEIKGDHAPIGGLYPTSSWRQGEYVVDRHRLHIDYYKSRTGTYDVWLGFTRRGAPVPVSESAAPRDLEQRVKIGQVKISKGAIQMVR